MMSLYEWMRALHILAVIALMAGLLYLPRLFVYHVKNSDKSDVTDVLELMETNLLKIIINPSLIVVWLLGFFLLHIRAQSQGLSILWEPWMLVKLISALVLTAYHGFLTNQTKKIKSGISKITEKEWRMLNEVPFVLAIIMVISVVIEYGA